MLRQIRPETRAGTPRPDVEFGAGTRRWTADQGPGDTTRSAIRSRERLLSPAIGMTLAALVHLAYGFVGPQRVDVMSALAGTSAFVHLGLALESASLRATVRHWVAAGSTWALGYAGLRLDPRILPVAFLLHALFGAFEIACTEDDPPRRRRLAGWTSFHLGIAILLAVAPR